MARAVMLDTRFPIEVCKDRLAISIDVEKIGLSLSGFGGSRPILGKIDDNSFRLQKRRYYRNSFAPFFFGRFVASESGTRIEGAFGLHPFVKIFMAIWFSFLGIFIMTTLTSVIAGRTNFQARMFAIPVGMAVFGIALVKFGQLLGRNEDREIVEFLEKTFEAR